MGRIVYVVVCVLSLLFGGLIAKHKDMRLYNEANQSLVGYFNENRSYENRDEIFWVEKTDRMIPVITASFDEVEDFSVSFFSIPLSIAEHSPSWEIHDLRLDDGHIEEIVFRPVYTDESKCVLDHFGDEVSESMVSPIDMLKNVCGDGYYSLQQIAASHYCIPHYSVVDDFGYSGIFGSANRGPVEKVVLGEYLLVASGNDARFRDFATYSICCCVVICVLLFLLTIIVIRK